MTVVISKKITQKISEEDLAKGLFCFHVVNDGSENVYDDSLPCGSLH